MNKAIIHGHTQKLLMQTSDNAQLAWSGLSSCCGHNRKSPGSDKRFIHLFTLNCMKNFSGFYGLSGFYTLFCSGLSINYKQFITGLALDYQPPVTL